MPLAKLVNCSIFYFAYVLGSSPVQSARPLIRAGTYLKHYVEALVLSSLLSPLYLIVATLSFAKVVSGGSLAAATICQRLLLLPQPRDTGRWYAGPGE